jgi:hypothetical protein
MLLFWFVFWDVDDRLIAADAMSLISEGGNESFYVLGDMYP